MNRRRSSITALIGALLAVAAPARGSEPTAALLQRQTQELLDAVTHGRAAVWERYLDARATYTAEDGTVYGRKDLVAQIRPLPPGVSGVLRVQDFAATVHGSVAITTYVSDEHERFHGHELHCQYRETDTWLRTRAGWRLIAAQVLALRTDPPAVALRPGQLDEYVGRYALAPDVTYEIRRKGAGLEGQETGGKPHELRAEARDVLFVPGRPRYRRVFRRGADGRVTGFAERREAWDLDWKRIAR